MTLAVAVPVSLIFLSCCYHNAFATMQLEASKEVENDSRWQLDNVLVEFVVVTAGTCHCFTPLQQHPAHTNLPQPSSTGWLSTRQHSGQRSVAEMSLA